MEKMIINADAASPEINFDPDLAVLEISGESYPENALEFYKPVFKWLREFLNVTNKKITVNYKLIYFNTSSSKAILDMLDLFEEKHKKHNNVKSTGFSRKMTRIYRKAAKNLPKA